MFPVYSKWSDQEEESSLVDAFSYELHQKPLQTVLHEEALDESPLADSSSKRSSADFSEIDRSDDPMLADRDPGGDSGFQVTLESQSLPHQEILGLALNFPEYLQESGIPPGMQQFNALPASKPVTMVESITRVSFPAPEKVLDHFGDEDLAELAEPSSKIPNNYLDTWQATAEPLPKSATIKRSKACLVDDYIHQYHPGDDTFKSVIQDELVPYCRLNYLGIDYFLQHPDISGVNDVDGYSYEINHRSNVPKRPEDDIGRFNNSPVNFYEPRVLRVHKAKDLKRQGREGLCPFCELPSDPTTDDISLLFYNLNSSAYLHHVTKQHGVYSNGSEMPVPAIIGTHKEVRPMKTSTRVSLVDVVTCPVCYEKVKIQPSDGDGHNRFLGYFRHMLKHNMKKNNGKSR